MVGQAASVGGYRRILIVMAMDTEARPVVAALGERWGQQPAAAPVEPPLPMRGWRFVRPDGGEVILTINGEDPRHGVDSVGTQPAALATHAGIRRFGPDLVLTVGTAGALPGAAAVGEVFHAAGFRFHDRRIVGVAAGFEGYGVYAMPAAALGAFAGTPSARPAVISSGNALTAACVSVSCVHHAHTGAAHSNSASKMHPLFILAPFLQKLSAACLLFCHTESSQVPKRKDSGETRRVSPLLKLAGMCGNRTHPAWD